MGRTERGERKEKEGRKVTELEYSPRNAKQCFRRHSDITFFAPKRRGPPCPPKSTEKLKRAVERHRPQQCGQTLMILGMCSFGVSRPKQASTPQNSRMEKTLEKSAMKALTWRQMGNGGRKGN